MPLLYGSQRLFLSCFYDNLLVF